MTVLRGGASALVVFARAPVPGFCKTRLAKGIGEVAAAELYDAMLRDTLDAVSAMTNVRKVLYAAPEQDGEKVLRSYVSAEWEIVLQPPTDLTGRLAKAFGAYDEPVACIGTDAPLSPFGALEDALHAWASDVLMGPSRDGGYWCIGMKKLDHALLDGMPWSTSAVSAETLKRTNALGLTMQALPETFDVDETDDLVVLRAALAENAKSAAHTRAAIGRIR